MRLRYQRPINDELLRELERELDLSESKPRLSPRATRTGEGARRSVSRLPRSASGYPMLTFGDEGYWPVARYAWWTNDCGFNYAVS